MVSHHRKVQERLVALCIRCPDVIGPLDQVALGDYDEAIAKPVEPELRAARRGDAVVEVMQVLNRTGSRWLVRLPGDRGCIPVVKAFFFSVRRRWKRGSPTSATIWSGWGGVMEEYD